MEQYIDFVLDQWVLFLALVVVLALIIRSWVAQGVSGVKEIRPQEAIRLMNNDNAANLDVRLENEYKSGHIVNAIHIPLGVLEGRLREIEKYKQTPVIVSCRSGQRSMRAARLLRKQGFEKVYSLGGGLMAWEKDNLPLTKGR